MRRVDPANLVHRCPHCGTRLPHCVCLPLPRLPTRTRFVFLQHAFEQGKPTNTARLACRILDSASILPWDRLHPPALGPTDILLYPLPGSRILHPDDLTSDRRVLIPDGTWSQAAKMANVLHRQGWIGHTLDASTPPSSWGARHGGSLQRISSAEAAAAVLSLAGESRPALLLRDAVAQVGARILAMRGLLSELDSASS